MSYVGNTPTQQAFTPAIDYFNGTGSQTAFTLSRTVASVAQVQVVVNNVAQNPGSTYTVSGNTITFVAAPSAGTNNVYVRYTSPITQVATLTQAPSVLGPMSVSVNGAIGLGGATNPIVNMSASANNYAQAYVNNTSNGTGASADLVVYPDNGTDASGWVDMGITSSTFSNATYGITGANEGYLFMSAPSGASKTGNLVIATDSTGTQNAIKFATGGFGSTTERMRIDSSGNVGIGTTPTYRFQVGPNNSLNDNLAVFNESTTAGGGGVNIANYYNNTTNIAGIKFCSDSATIGKMVFYTNAGSGIVERARIDSSGNFMFNQTASAGGQTGGGTFIRAAGATGSSSILLSHATGTGNANSFAEFFLGASQIGAITQATSSTVNYATSSDYRLKENVQPMMGALEKVAQLKPCTYTWKIDGVEGQGFIAHELQEVVPDCVTGVKDGVETYTDEDGNEQTRPKYQGIDTSFLVATLTAAIQELNAKFEEYKAAHP